MKRVLQIVDSMDLGGIQVFIMNIYREIIKYNIQFDFMVFHKEKQYFEDEISSLGGRVYKIPSRRNGVFLVRRKLGEFFDNHKGYDVIHYHTSSLSFMDPVEIARKKKIKRIVIHSHSTRAPGSKIHTLLHYLNRKRVKNYADEFIACGELAAKWLYNGSGVEEQVKILYNCVDANRFSFDSTLRDCIRVDLGIQNDLVLGHIGRFSKVKNHKFLLEILNYGIKVKQNKKIKLISIGDGELKSNIENQASSLGILDNIIFIGQTLEISKYLQAMDVFLLPSIYEGLPVSVIEAQANGVSVLMSDTITSEVVCNENVYKLGLNQSLDDWYNKILASKNRIRNINISKFDIDYIVKEILRLYEI